MKSGFSTGFLSAPVAKSKATASLQMRFYLFFFVAYLNQVILLRLILHTEIRSSLLILRCLFHIYHEESVHYRSNLIGYDFYRLERMSLVLLSAFIKLKLLTSPSSTKIHILSFLFLGTRRDSCEFPASTAVAVLAFPSSYLKVLSIQHAWNTLPSPILPFGLVFNL